MSQHSKHSERTHFEALEVDTNASKEDIKKSYLRLAKIWHPDVNGSAEAGKKFQRISQAYDILKDDSKRAQYLSNIQYTAKYGEPTTVSGDVYEDYNRRRAAGEYKATADVKGSFWSNWRSYGRRSTSIATLILVPLFGVGAVLYSITSSNKKTVKYSTAKATNAVVTGKGRGDGVEAWYNSETNRWETPAPWNPLYQ
eukprot:gene40935-49931_t